MAVSDSNSKAGLFERETVQVRPVTRSIPDMKPEITKPAKRETAESMATRQKEISISEFFAKNRHLLGFDNPRKALLTAVKEAVDNSLDACEEAGILPCVTVVIEDLEPARLASQKSSRYRVSVIDNGPGIVRKQVENVFGRLLFGSKFHRLKMSRGQQGIGISAAGMYGLITTGKPMVIHTRPGAKKPAHHIELAMNTKTNRAEVTVDTETDDFPPQRFRSLARGTRDPSFLALTDFVSGTSVSIELEGRYQKGRGSVDEFLELTAIANPHALITFVPPTRVMEEEKDDDTGKNKVEQAMLIDDKAAQPDPTLAVATPTILETIERDGVTLFPRGTQLMPPETKEIQPHPKGVELGTLLQMIKDHQHDQGGTLYQFLQDKFCRVSPANAATLCEKIKLSSRSRLASVEASHVESLYKAFDEVRFAPPPTDCLAPIGVQQLLKGITKGVKAEFYCASTREAAVYRGRPFQIEAAIAFGGELPAQDTARVIRFANRVPLLFQPSACSSFKACVETGWRNYNLSQPRGSLPVGALVIMIHMASVWVPFTSESKEAIADYDEIRKEMKLALMECGRKLGTYLRKRQAMAKQAERRDVFERYIGEISRAVHAINGEDAKKLYESLLSQAKKRTAIADAKLDEEGKVVKADEELKNDDSVVMVEARMTRTSEQAAAEEPTAESDQSTHEVSPIISLKKDKPDRPRQAGKDKKDQGRLF